MSLSAGTRLLITVLLFYAGWVKFTFDGADVYLADYAQRIVILTLGLASLRDGFTPPWPRAPERVWTFAALGALAIMVADMYTQSLPWRGAFDDFLFPGASFPEPPGPAWAWLDLTFGLALVALSEELVFRKLWADWRDSRPGHAEWKLYAGSTLAFACLHLPQGLADTAVAALWGLLLMAVYRKGGSLPLVVLIHFLADLWYFA